MTSTSRSFLSVGEAMIEMSAGSDGQWRMGFAGDTLNTAWYARALLDPSWRVSYLTGLGTDRYSNAMRAFIAESGIETDRIATVADRRPGLYFIHQEHGDRHFTYWRDQSAARLLAEDRNRLDAALAGAGVIYLSGITLAILNAEHRANLLAALGVARKNGTTIVLDPNIRPRLWPDPTEMAQAIEGAAGLCDIVLPTFGDDAAAFGDGDPQATARRYRALGVGEVVVKDGDRDALVVTHDGETRLAAVKVAEVVDATGAGDSFNGAYLAARFSGRPVAEALSLAHRVASTCIGHHGALAPRSALRFSAG